MLEARKLLKSELKTELFRTLDYWAANTIDSVNGGFVGRIDYWNTVVPDSPKGIILNTRILWAFSAASNHIKTNDYQHICERAYQYLSLYFKDDVHKGVFWELDHKGNPINYRKQIYAQAFAIYALSEYYIFSKKEEAKQWAIELFNIIETSAKDKLNKGYWEAFNQDWSPIEDMRLSPKDMNAAKTMNTHLHILEAYTRLSDIYDNGQLQSSLQDLVHLFQHKFLNTKSHFDLFFDANWNLLSTITSYGHDIETAWLLLEAAKRVKDIQLLSDVEKMVIQVVDTFLEVAIDRDGGVINEKDYKSGLIDADRHWWPQMEAIVGLKYAYQLTKNPNYMKPALSIWKFTKNHLIDQEHGEWHFRVDKNGKTYTQEDKVSMWKAPYHVVRSCILMNTEINGD